MMAQTLDRDAVAADAERLTAYHEAGHAVMAEVYGRLITRVEIEGDSEHTGSVESLRIDSEAGEKADGEAVRQAIEERLKCILAGTVAEGMVSGRDQWPESSEDLDLAVRLAMRLVENCEDVLPLLERLRGELVVELERHWGGVERLAAELLRKKSLDGSEVRRLLSPEA